MRKLITELHPGLISSLPRHSSSRLLQVISRQTITSSNSMLLHRRRRSLLWRSCFTGEETRCYEEAAATCRRRFTVSASSLLQKWMLDLAPLLPLFTHFCRKRRWSTVKESSSRDFDPIPVKAIYVFHLFFLGLFPPPLSLFTLIYFFSGKM